MVVEQCRLVKCLKGFLSLQMSDVVTALKLSNEGSGAGGPSSPLDADHTAVDIEAGNVFVCVESFFLK